MRFEPFIKNHFQLRNPTTATTEKKRSKKLNEKTHLLDGFFGMMLFGSVAGWYSLSVVTVDFSGFIAGGMKCDGVPKPKAALVRSKSFNRAKL